MSAKRVFFQDFLFEDMPVDNNEYPDVSIEYTEKQMIVYDKEVSFDMLLRMNKPEEWEQLYKEISHKIVILSDDIPITNVEMKYYKDFYFMAYYYTLSKHCKKCLCCTLSEKTA